MGEIFKYKSFEAEYAEARRAKIRLAGYIIPTTCVAFSAAALWIGIATMRDFENTAIVIAAVGLSVFAIAMIGILTKEARVYAKSEQKPHTTK